MSERLTDATIILHYELEAPPTSMEVCNRSAHCKGLNGCQPHNLSTLLLLAAPTRSAHGRAGATGSVRHKRVRCNSDTISAVPKTINSAIPKTINSAIPKTINSAIPKTINSAIPKTMHSAIANTMRIAIRTTMNSACQD
jgi:hypothetical protein